VTETTIWAPRGARVRIVSTPRPGEAIGGIALSVAVEAIAAVVGWDGPASLLP
jgi:hypothetical protein